MRIYKKNFSLTVTSHLKSMLRSEQKKFMREVEWIVKPIIKFEFCINFFCFSCPCIQSLDLY